MKKVYIFIVGVCLLVFFTYPVNASFSIACNPINVFHQNYQVELEFNTDGLPASSCMMGGYKVNGDRSIDITGGFGQKKYTRGTPLNGWYGERMSAMIYHMDFGGNKFYYKDIRSVGYKKVLDRFSFDVSFTFVFLYKNPDVEMTLGPQLLIGYGYVN